jgi:hypothetical protein
LDRLKVAINKSAEGARAVLLNPNQQTIPSLPPKTRPHSERGGKYIRDLPEVI